MVAGEVEMIQFEKNLSLEEQRKLKRWMPS
jgi:hypothetical protein